MSEELTAEGIAHHWVGIHGRTAETIKLQGEIASVVRYPLLQEVGDENLRVHWKYKTRHDIFVFGPDGALRKHIEDVIDAHTPDGYARVKAEIRPLLTPVAP